MIESLLALFVVGSLGFWLLVGGILVALVWCADYEYGWASTGILVVAALLFWFGYGFDPIRWIISHPWYYTVIAVLGYFGIGAVYSSLIRWPFYVQAIMDEHKDFIAKFKQENGDIKTNPELRDVLFRELRLRTKGLDFPPSVANNKARIMYWIGYWPFSAAWTLIDRPFHYITQYLYNRITGVMTYLTKRIVEANL